MLGLDFSGQRRTLTKVHEGRKAERTREGEALNYLPCSHQKLDGFWLRLVDKPQLLDVPCL